MTRIYDYTLITVIALISYTVHVVAVELFAPGKGLHEVASQATQFDGAAKADLWFEVLAVWIEVIAIAGIVAWALLREYRRQVATAPVRAR